MQLNWKSSKKLGTGKEKVIVFMVFILSLLFLFVNFYLYRHFMTSMDEYDNLTSAFLMTRGYKLYKDIFNMHYTLPFYWVELFFISRSIDKFKPFIEERL